MRITNIFIDVAFAPDKHAEVRMQKAEVGYDLILNSEKQVPEYVAYMKANHRALEELVHANVNIIEEK